MKFKPTELDEQRVELIGRTMSAVGVDSGGRYEGKADWYLARFREKWPALRAEFSGALGPGVDMLTVHSPVVNQN